MATGELRLRLVSSTHPTIGPLNWNCIGEGVKRGEELLLDYGEGYWQGIGRHNRKDRVRKAKKRTDRYRGSSEDSDELNLRSQ